MNKKDYKIQQKKKIIIGLTISLLAGILLLCFLYSGVLKNSSLRDPAKEDAVVELDYDSLKIDETTILHKPDFISVNVTFTKKPTIVYEAPKTPSISNGKKYCVLTFDDGPGINSTQRILNVLEKYKIKATWFVLGSRVLSYPQMAQKIANAGHELGNHSYSHPDLTTLSQDGYMKEIESTQNAIAAITHYKAVLLRPPYGSYTAEIAQNCNLSIALWNVDSLDWSHRYAPAIYSEVMSHLSTHSIILFHDIYDFTAEAVEMIVPELVRQGYTFITYSQYLQLS